MKVKVKEKVKEKVRKNRNPPKIGAFTMKRMNSSVSDQEKMEKSLHISRISMSIEFNT